MARRDIGCEALIYPQPVLIIATYDEQGHPDAMTAAWGCVSDTSEVTLCLSKTHKTVENILNRRAFTVSIGTRSLVRQCDYFGLVSGHQEIDKIERAGLNQVKSAHVDAPVITQFPLTLECRFKSIDEESEFIKGEVVNVTADESILDEDGRIDTDRLEAISYDPSDHRYVLVKGDVDAAFSCGKIYD